MAPKNEETKNTPTVTRKRKENLALPSYSIADIKIGESIFITPLAEMVTKPVMKKDGSGPEMDGDKEKMITVVKVADLNTGEVGEMVCPYIIAKAFTGAPDYVGEHFELVKGKKNGRTNEWAVYLLEKE